MMKNWWKNPKLLGVIIYYGLKLLTSTMRITVNKHHAIDDNTGYLFAFWHGKQLLPAPVIINQHHTAMYTMVSPSRDGTILASVLRKIGYSIIRGSSRDNGARALLTMKNKLQHGASVGFGIDGPIGPIHVIKPGIIFLAQKCNIAIIPVGSAFSNYWQFNKAWDKFELAKPFSTAALVMGKPYIVPKNADINTACLELAKILQQTEQQALKLLS